MPISHKLMNGVRAGLVAVALGGAAVAGAAPAQAAVGFSFNFGMPGPGPGVVLRFGSPNFFKYCATNNQIRRELRRHGYTDIDLVKSVGNKVWATAKKKGKWYQLRIDRCSGDVDNVHVITRLGNGHFQFVIRF